LGVDLQLILFFLVYVQDAAGLTQLSSTVEDVFASGDLPRAAETLASMRNCLSAVGEVVLCQLQYSEDLSLFPSPLKVQFLSTGCRIC